MDKISQHDSLDAAPGPRGSALIISHGGPHPSLRAILAGAITVLVLAGLMPLTASAKQARLLTGRFGAASTAPANPYPLRRGGRVAVDETTHDVYVTDVPGQRIEKFDADGNFLLMIGTEVNKTAIEELRPEAEQNLCPDSGHPTDVCQAGSSSDSPTAFDKPEFIAVDNSSDPSRGDLYVGNAGRGENAIQAVKVDATGGTFTLSFAGKTSQPIPFDAPHLQVEGPHSMQAALEEIVGYGNTRILESPAGTYSIEFDSQLGFQDLPAMTADSSALTGGAATATVSTTRHGFSTARIAKLDPTGKPITSWAEGGALNGSNVSSPPALFPGPFVELEGAAVDATGDLWVLGSSGKVFRFTEDAKYLTDWKDPEPIRPVELAVSPAEVVYFRDKENEVGSADSTGRLLGVIAPSKAELEQFRANAFQAHGVATDRLSGDLYVDGVQGPFADEEGLVQRYDASCHPAFSEESPQPGCAAVEAFGVGGVLSKTLGGLATDASTPADSVYVVDGDTVATFSLTVPGVVTTAPTDPTSSSATLTGTVDPAGVELDSGLEGCRFEWGESTTYGHVVPCDRTAAEIGAGSGPVAVHAAITGLEAGKTYHYRLVAANANDNNSIIEQPSFGEDVGFGPPLLEPASALSASAASAVLAIEVNPNDLDTRVRLEYGLDTSYGSTTPDVDAGSAGALQTESLELAGLSPDTTYHYRAVAENVLGEGSERVIGPDQTFSTEPKTGFSLLDNRAWELVSPPDKHGANIEGLDETGVIQASDGGDAISYLANAPTEAGAAGNANAKVQVLSARASGTWSSTDLATPHTQPVGTTAGPGAEYKFFTPDLSLAAVEPTGAFDPAISSEASEKTPYLRTDFPPGAPGAFCSGSCYQPLVTAGNVPPGTAFGEETRDCSGVFCGPQFLGATSDLSHILLTAKASLVEGAPPNSLYEWSAGHLQAISVLSEGHGFDQHTRIKELPVGSISADGSRVVWAEDQEQFVSGRHLYLRDSAAGAGGETLRLDRVKGGTGTGVVKPEFQSASSDASLIYFTDQQQLTPGSGARLDEPDLYRCQIVTNEAGELECDLTDLTPPNGPESADVLGVIRGADADGAFTYFVAQAALAPGASPGDCTAQHANTIAETEVQSCNLYLSRKGATTFIASLSGVDRIDWKPYGTARLSPNGKRLAFMSERRLTAYDNRDVTSGRPVAEVYTYDSESGQLRCVSCDPTGARPHGVEYEKLLHGLDGGAGGGAPEPERQELVAAKVPAWTGMNSGGRESAYQDRYLFDSGRVFFDSTGALVPQDSNGTIDAYEYEPVGVGDCTEASPTFTTRSSGCINLLSNGLSRKESVFLDASESGDDAFFLTSAQLSKRDSDSSYDVYDARVDGGEPEPVKPVECLGAACQGVFEPPNDPTPNSLTFQGPGNLVAPLIPPRTSKTAIHRTNQGKTPRPGLKSCRKLHKRRPRHACEVQARKHFGPIKKGAPAPHKATPRRRTSR